MNTNQVEELLKIYPSLKGHGLHFLGIFHDLGCPQSDRSGQSGACTCKSVDVRPISQKEWRNSQATTRRARRKAKRAATKAIRKAKSDS